MKQTEISIGELAREAGVSTATINFYVKEGVLPPPRKLNRTRAAYNERHRRLLRLIRRYQSTGLSLALIKKMLAGATTDEAIERLESIGYFGPLPAARRAPDPTPIEQFDPIERAAFLELAGIDEATLAALESYGVVRPREKGSYGARELWVVRNVSILLADGIPLEQLQAFTQLLPALRALVPLVQTSAERHVEDLAARRLRYRDIIEVFTNVEQYMFDRLQDEERPGWREELFSPLMGED